MFDTKKKRSDFEHLKIKPPVIPHPLPTIIYPNTPEAEAAAKRKARSKSKPAPTKPAAPVNVTVNVQLTHK